MSFEALVCLTSEESSDRGMQNRVFNSFTSSEEELNLDQNPSAGPNADNEDALPPYSSAPPPPYVSQSVSAQPAGNNIVQSRSSSSSENEKKQREHGSLQL